MVHGVLEVNLAWGLAGFLRYIYEDNSEDSPMVAHNHPEGGGSRFLRRPRAAIARAEGEAQASSDQGPLFSSASAASPRIFGDGPSIVQAPESGVHVIEGAFVTDQDLAALHRWLTHHRTPSRGHAICC